VNILIAWIVLVIALICAGLLPVGTDLLVWSYFLFLTGMFISLPAHVTWPHILAQIPPALWFFIIGRRAVSSVIYLAREPDFLHKTLSVPRMFFYAILTAASAFFTGSIFFIFSGLSDEWHTVKLWQDALGVGLISFYWLLDILSDNHLHTAVATVYKLLSSNATDSTLAIATIATVVGGCAAMAWPKNFSRDALFIRRLANVMDPPIRDVGEHLRGGQRT